MSKLQVKSGAIWWSIDPFNENMDFYRPELKILASIARSLSTVIQPVAYLDTFRSSGRYGNYFPLSPVYEDDLLSVRKEAEDRISSLIPNSDRKIVRETCFLSNQPDSPPSLSEKVSEVVKTALKYKALLIAIRTHSYRGLRRLYMGSFSETLLLQSNLPTLVFPAKSNVPVSMKQAIFATDFSKESYKALVRIIPLIKKQRASLSILHIRDYSNPRPLRSVDELTSLKTSLKQAEDAATRFTQLAARSKLKADLILADLKHGENKADAIFRVSKKMKADLISLAAKSSPLQAALAGSLTRSIVRNSDCPVLVFRSK